MVKKDFRSRNTLLESSLKAERYCIAHLQKNRADEFAGDGDVLTDWLGAYDAISSQLMERGEILLGARVELTVATSKLESIRRSLKEFERKLSVARVYVPLQTFLSEENHKPLDAMVLELR